MPPEPEPVAQSFLDWTYQALGLFYAVLLPAAALVCFVLVLIVVIRGRGPMAAAALLLIVPVPLLVGVYAAFTGFISSYTVIATSPTPPRPSEVALGISTALAAPVVGMLLTVPGYLAAVLGGLIRAMIARPNTT